MPSTHAKMWAESLLDTHGWAVKNICSILSDLKMSRLSCVLTLVSSQPFLTVVRIKYTRTVQKQFLCVN